MIDMTYFDFSEILNPEGVPIGHKLPYSGTKNGIIPQNPIPEEFLPGNIPWFWLTRADHLGGSALPVALLVYRKNIMTHKTGWSNKIGLESGLPMGLGRSATRNGLKRLAKGGLIELIRQPGSKPVVKITKASLDPPPGQKRLFIYRQVPWDWVCRAAQCPTPGLLVGLAAWKGLWLAQGDDVVKVCTNPLAGSERGTRELLRGFKAIEAAGLVKVVKIKAGIVTLRILSQADILSEPGSG